MGDLRTIFDDIFGFGASPSRKKENLRRGSDIELAIEIPLESVLKDQTKEVNLSKYITCPRCHGTGAEPGTSVKKCFSCGGTGRVQQIKKTPFGSFTRYTVCPECGGEGVIPEKPCNVCKGEGRKKGEERIKIFIPAGVDSNQVMKMEGKGNAGRRGGKSGDLYVRILIKKNPIFERKGDDLLLRKSISFSQAVLGDRIEIPTLDGSKLSVKIPAGIESGKIVKMPGKGIPHFSRWGKGALYIEFIIKIPRRLTRKQKELLEKLKEEGL